MLAVEGDSAVRPHDRRGGKRLGAVVTTSTWRKLLHAQFLVPKQREGAAHRREGRGAEAFSSDHGLRSTATEETYCSKATPATSARDLSVEREHDERSKALQHSVRSEAQKEALWAPHNAVTERGHAPSLEQLPVSERDKAGNPAAVLVVGCAAIPSKKLALKGQDSSTDGQAVEKRLPAGHKQSPAVRRSATPRHVRLPEPPLPPPLPPPQRRSSRNDSVS